MSRRLCKDKKQLNGCLELVVETVTRKGRRETGGGVVSTEMVQASFVMMGVTQSTY
jgi:hypothetical protein